MDEPIEIKCDVPGHEDEKILYKRKGWKFKHMRLWQSALVTSSLTIDELTELITERIESWTLTLNGGEDEVVPFEPGKEALDEFNQEMSNWIVVSFKEAYNLAGLPFPNA